MPHLACRIRRVPNVRGFSLLELLIVLVIFAIMASIAVPSFQSLRQQQQLTDASNELVAALRLARGEAIMREAVCTVNEADEVKVTLSPRENQDWTQGWRIDAKSTQGADTLIVHTALPILLSGPSGETNFDALGHPCGNDAEAEWRLSHAGLSDGASRQVCLTMIGRAYVAESDKGCGS
ncbi:GspH/FimT family pseudopilin [Chromohalobacter israelensis]|uniref:GspH/FimT family pseudopilin n=1 Tax=Chromohalobacter israelensis TaxID=141390 RepID=UPI001CC8243C|nr:GspH/FimT family pseudopilin [Chromohalobacter salexigens]MBZ5877540.1 GspH/FimT family pseudopilin [Chromohalobacter salexigens]